MEPFGVIYLVTNYINQKRYIGSTTKRGKELEAYLGSGRNIQRAVRKYGASSFSKVVLQECFVSSYSELHEIETQFIQLLRPEYNIATKGGGGNLGPEACRHISEAKKGQPCHPNCYSIEAVVKRTAKNTGQKRSPETREKLAKALEKARSARTQEPWNKGKTVSEELREKYRQAKLGTHQSEETKNKKRQKLKGRIAIHTSTELKFVKKSDLQSFLNQGWELGKGNIDKNRRSLVGYVGITNPTLHQNRNVPKESVKLFISQGWELGRRNFEK